MANIQRERPDDEDLECFIIKDGYLWWNPHAMLPQSSRRSFDEPIGFWRNHKFPTIRVGGVMHCIHRINYLMHTGEWPEILCLVDDDKSALHIDNIKASNMSEVHNGKDQRRPRKPYYIREYHCKNGVTHYHAMTHVNNVVKQIGTFKTYEDAEQAGKSMHWLLNRKGHMPDMVKRVLISKAVYR